MDLIILLPIIAGVIALAYAGFLAFRILKEEEGTDEMKSIAKAIREGAKAISIDSTGRSSSLLP